MLSREAAGAWSRGCLAAVQLREDMHAAAEAFDRIDRALVTEISRQQGVAPKHEHCPFAGLLHLAMPSDATVLLQRSPPSQEGNVLVIAKWERHYRSNGVRRHTSITESFPLRWLCDVVDNRLLGGRQRTGFSCSFWGRRDTEDPQSPNEQPNTRFSSGKDRHGIHRACQLCLWH